MMGFACGCDDFYPEPGQTYWESCRPTTPNEGQKCCECNSPLQAVKSYETPELIIYEDGIYSAWELVRTADGGDMDFLDFTPDEDDPGVQSFAMHHDYYDGDFDGEINDNFEDDVIEAIETITEWRWNGEWLHWTKHIKFQLRCERCEGLAIAFTGSTKGCGLGYCDPGPGYLLESHAEQTDFDGQKSIRWRSDKNGVLQPIHVERPNI